MYPQCPQSTYPPSTLLLCAAESSLCCSSYPDHQSKGILAALSLPTVLYLTQQFMHVRKWLLNMCFGELVGGASGCFPNTWLSQGEEMLHMCAWGWVGAGHHFWNYPLSYAGIWKCSTGLKTVVPEDGQHHCIQSRRNDKLVEETLAFFLLTLS